MNKGTCPANNAGFEDLTAVSHEYYVSNDPLFGMVKSWMSCCDLTTELS